jgi:hypothetical protein
MRPVGRKQIENAKRALGDRRVLCWAGAHDFEVLLLGGEATNQSIRMTGALNDPRWGKWLVEVIEHG